MLGVRDGAALPEGMVDGLAVNEGAAEIDGSNEG